jgi:predicted SAM-dependent methyltransferase
MKKLHLCSGESKLHGWLSVDARADTKPDIVSDIALLPFELEAQSVDEIYLCHGLEHIPFADAEHVLSGLCKLLKPQGVMRLAVPDFEVLTDMYQEGVPLALIRGALMGGQDYPLNTHYSVWDYKLLKVTMEHAGLQDVKRYDAFTFISQNGGPNFFDWSIGKIEGRFISLNLIGVKNA